MKPHVKILVGIGVVFILWASFMQFRDIQKQRKFELDHPEMKKQEMYVGPDGRLVTPALRSKQTSSNMNACMSCKIHKDK